MDHALAMEDGSPSRPVKTTYRCNHNQKDSLFTFHPLRFMMHGLSFQIMRVVTPQGLVWNIQARARESR